MESWYVVCCKPRQEAAAEENLHRHGFQIYLPHICTRQRSRGQWVNAVEVLFHRYIFIQLDAQLRSIAPIRSTRGVVGLLQFGGHPAVVPNAVMDALLQREDVESGLHLDTRQLFSAGVRIKLVDGPLSGMEGVLTQQDGDQRVVVLLELLGNVNKVTVSRDWVALAT